MTAFVDVLRPGMLTTVQDLGRWGWQSRGVSVAGAMDPFSLRLANALVGNERRAAVLEITMTGPDLQFHDARSVAVAGAVFPLYVDGIEMPPRHIVDVPAGGRLTFGPRAAGARAYLAVAGGFDVPAVLGSRATHVPTGIGGWQGRALVKGDRLPLAASVPSSRRHVRTLAVAVRLPGQRPLRVLPGPDLIAFDAEGLPRLQAAPYVVDVHSDRMGFRLQGTAIATAGAHGLQPSDVTAIGTVQIPPSGQPIVLMADRQTTGGYPRLATVITADLGALGQCAPGDQLAFEVCTMTHAREALLDVERPLMMLEAVR